MIKVLGAPSWKEAYRIMSKRFQLPSGKYTEKRHVVFGKGRAAGVDVWVLVQHSSNAKPVQRTNRNGEVIRVVELRLCVQNVCNVQALVQISSTRLLSHGGERHESSLAIDEISLIARNGKQVPREVIGEDGWGFVELRANEFAVVSCAVCCPSDIEYETDLLARMSEFSFECHLPVGSRVIEFPPRQQRNGNHAMAMGLLKQLFRPSKILGSFLDEKYIFQCYDQLPGGLVLFTGNDGLGVH